MTFNENEFQNFFLISKLRINLPLLQESLVKVVVIY